MAGGTDEVFGMGKRRGRDRTLELGGGGGKEHRKVLKNGDIGRDTVSMCIRRVVVITSLNSGITEEDTLCGFD